MISPIQEFFLETKSEYAVISSGVDWITITGDSQGSKERVAKMARDILDDGMLQGQRLVRTSRSGYTLTGVEGFQWGQGHKGWMCCLTGEKARKLWLPFYAVSKNCTRLDIQCTIAYADYDEESVSKIYTSARNANTAHWLQRVTLILNNHRGSTVYYGSRTSSQYGRIYDKYRHSKMNLEFDRCIRFEVEYKKPVSGYMAKELVRDLPDERGMASIVLSWFQHRGFATPEVGTTPYNEPQIGRKESSIERKLRWLAQSIRPTYQQLRMAGFQSEADEALGVTEDLATYSDNLGTRE